MHGSMKPRTAFALLLPLLGFGCRSAERSEKNEIVSLVRHGHYKIAFERARELAREHPEDVALTELARDAEVAMLLDQGRNEVLQGRIANGLSVFERARELAPENPMVATWIEKTSAQLAREWLDRAADLGAEDLEEAQVAYETVLKYAPDNGEAKYGLARTLLLQNHRQIKSKSYFDEGVRSFRDLWLDQARRGFQVSHRYKENDPALLHGHQVDAMIAQERLAQARGLEGDGLYFAARNEYRLVLLIEPDNPDARDGFDRMDREVRATRSISSADMDIRRGDLEGAAKVLEETEGITEAQKADVAHLKVAIEDAQFEDLYLEAVNLETQYRYPEAIAVYGELIGVAPDFQDAAMRKKTLEEWVSTAEDVYARALATEDEAEAELLLTQITIIWPEYRDVVQRLAEMRARRASDTKDDPDAAQGGD